MNPLALVFWLGSWGIIAGVTIWCFYRMITEKRTPPETPAE